MCNSHCYPRHVTLAAQCFLHLSSGVDFVLLQQLADAWITLHCSFSLHTIPRPCRCHCNQRHVTWAAQCFLQPSSGIDFVLRQLADVWDYWARFLPAAALSSERVGTPLVNLWVVAGNTVEQFRRSECSSQGGQHSGFQGRLDYCGSNCCGAIQGSVSVSLLGVQHSGFVVGFDDLGRHCCVPIQWSECSGR
jgi:hypothetical protein